MNDHAVVVPGGIGIDIAELAVGRFEVEGAPTYRAGRPPAGVCPRPCISPLHTHDVTGVIHIEAPTRTRFTLGQLFEEWGVRLDGSCIGGYCEPYASDVAFIDGKRQTGNPADILLLDHEENRASDRRPAPTDSREIYVWTK